MIRVEAHNSSVYVYKEAKDEKINKNMKKMMVAIQGAYIGAGCIEEIQNASILESSYVPGVYGTNEYLIKIDKFPVIVKYKITGKYFDKPVFNTVTIEDDGRVYLEHSDKKEEPHYPEEFLEFKKIFFEKHKEIKELWLNETTLEDRVNEIVVDGTYYKIPIIEIFKNTGVEVIIETVEDSWESGVDIWEKYERRGNDIYLYEKCEGCSCSSWRLKKQICLDSGTTYNII